MKNKKKVLCFDLDNVICKTTGSNYKKSKPIKKVIRFINLLYHKEFIIKIFTARYMGRNDEKIFAAKKQGYRFTKNQLAKWGLKYHILIFGKPTYDIFVDDKCLGFTKDWLISLKKDLKKL